MRSRTARLGILAAGVIGLLATGTPPVSANEVGSIAFFGNAITSGNLGYACTPGDIGTPKCPPVLTTDTKNGLKDTPKVNIDPGGQTVSFFFTAAFCTAANYTLGKSNKAPATTAPCTINAVGRIDGYCDFSLIKGIATIRILTTPIQTYDVTFWGQGFGIIVLKLQGTKATGGGEVQGEVIADATPIPEISTVPFVTNSCAAKSARNFTISGEGNYIVKTTLP